MTSKIREYTTVIFSYLLVTFILTFPMALHLSDYLAGDGGENHGFLWNYWWYHKAVCELKALPFYHTDYLFYPSGHSLSLNSIPITYGLLSIPLQAFFNLYTVHNLLLIFSFVMTGLGMYLLLGYLTQNRIAAFLGGFILMAAPWHLRVSMGHFHIMAIEWVPFFILYFLKAQQQYTLKNVLLASVFLTLAGLNTPYYLQYSLMFGILYVVFSGIQERKMREVIKRTAGIFLGAAVLLSPIVIPMIQEYTQHRLVGMHSSESFSADIMSFLIPSPYQVLGIPAQNFWYQTIGHDPEKSNYLGVVVVALAAWGVSKLWKKDKFVRFFSFAAICFFVLSLGMHLYVMGENTGILLPYAFLNKYVPGFSLSGVPSRLHAMTSLCLACLAAFGAREILQNHRKGKLIIAACFLLIAGEFSVLPYPLSPHLGVMTTTFNLPPNDPLAAVPRFYREMAKDKEEYALLDVSSGPYYEERSSTVDYYQTIHQKKIFGGDVARPEREKVREILTTPVLSEIIQKGLYRGIEAMPCGLRKDLAKKMLEKYHIRYVILPQTDDPELKNLIPEFYGLCKIYTDDKIIVYQACAAGTCLSLGQALPRKGR